jgi:hypothetical protein
MSDTTASRKRFTIQTVERRHPRVVRRPGDPELVVRPRLTDPRARTVEDLATVLTELSSVVSRLEAIAARHGYEPDLQARLRHAIAQLETIGHDLLTDENTSGIEGGIPRAAEGHDEAFLTWLAFHPASDDEEPISGPADGSFDGFFAGLEASPRVLPAEAAAKLGLASGTTIGEAARKLRTAQQSG